MITYLIIGINKLMKYIVYNTIIMFQIKSMYI